MRSVALDLGARKVAYCEVFEQRVVQRRTTTSLLALEDLLGPSQPPARVAIEACREAWAIGTTLREWGNEPVLVDTTRSRQLGIGQHGRKTDRIDAEVLALALERGTIPVAHMLSPHRQQLRLELGIRRALVESRAQYVTTARGIIRAEGGRLAPCETRTFVERARRADFADALHSRIEPLLCVLEQVQQQLVGVEVRIEQLCAEEPTIRLLTTVPGVGVIVASAFVSVLDEAGRFHNAHQVEAYLGLVPSERSSGDRRRLGSITKQGNSYMRALLVQAAWRLLCLEKTGDPLARWARVVSERRGNRVAVIALARRLAGVLWAM